MFALFNFQHIHQIIEMILQIFPISVQFQMVKSCMHLCAWVIYLTLLLVYFEHLFALLIQIAAFFLSSSLVANCALFDLQESIPFILVMANLYIFFKSGDRSFDGSKRAILRNSR